MLLLCVTCYSIFMPDLLVRLKLLNRECETTPKPHQSSGCWGWEKGGCGQLAGEHHCACPPTSTLEPWPGVGLCEGLCSCGSNGAAQEQQANLEMSLLWGCCDTVLRSHVPFSITSVIITQDLVPAQCCCMSHCPELHTQGISVFVLIYFYLILI